MKDKSTDKVNKKTEKQTDPKAKREKEEFEEQVRQYLDPDKFGWY